MEIPFKIILFQPEIDLFLFIFLFYLLLYKYFIQIILEKGGGLEVLWLDLKSMIFLYFFAYLNYAGMSFNFLIWEISWWLYLTFFIILMDGIMSLIYWPKIKKIYQKFLK